MAAASFKIFILAANGRTVEGSKDMEAIFKSLSVSADGNDNGLTITESSGKFDFNGKVLSNIADPVGPNDAATKGYTDTVAGGFDPKDSVDAATTAPLAAVTAAGTGVGKTLTADANGALVVDGVTVNDGDRVLVKNQVAGADNGIYDVTDKGSAGTPFILTRAPDFDNSPLGEVSKGAITTVTGGSTYLGQQWYLTTAGTITLDTTSLSFSQANINSFVDDAIVDGVTTRAPSQNAVFDALALKADTTYVDGKVIDSIADADTTHAPSRNAVFDALALKSNTGHTHVAADITDFDAAARAAVVVDSIADSDTTHAPSRNAVFDALALKQDYSDLYRSFANGEGGSIAHTIRQVTYQSAFGTMKKALATISALNEATLFGMVRDATIADTASGNYWLPKKGTIISGFSASSFTVNVPVYLSRSAAGGFTTTAPTTSGDAVVRLGIAVSDTELMWDPQYEYQVA